MTQSQVERFPHLLATDQQTRISEITIIVPRECVHFIGRMPTGAKLILDRQNTLRERSAAIKLDTRTP